MQRLAKLISVGRVPGLRAPALALVRGFSSSPTQLPPFADFSKKEPDGAKRPSAFPKSPRDLLPWLRRKLGGGFNADNPGVWFAGWSALLLFLLALYIAETRREATKATINVG